MASADLLIAIGILFLAGLALDAVGRHMHVPRVTLLILLGAFVGPPVLDMLPSGVDGTHDLYAPTALTMVAFLLGGSLHSDTLRKHGRAIIVVSLSVVFASVLIVSGGMLLAGLPLGFALMLGAIAAATDPAATRDVIVQTKSTGQFSTNVLGIVAIDDAWGLLAFSLAITLAGLLTGTAADGAFLEGLWEVGGAIGLGLLIGLPSAYLTGRIKPGEPTLIEALGIVFLCSGLALWLDLSFLLTGMVCGTVIVNLARHHDQPFHEIERIEWPFMLLFFVMAGASLELDALAEVSGIALAYIALRAISRLVGGWVGGTIARLPRRERRYMGLALMPQAGVAIGMALVAADKFPEIARPLLAITIGGTIAFEVFGPLLTQFALSKVTRGQIDDAHA